MDKASPRLAWSKCTANRWCKLLEVDTRRIDVHGVYVIWHGGFPSRVVRVGHGDLARELAERRGDARILAYMQQGPLFVTWAEADPSCAEGIARHLADRLYPRVAGPAFHAAAIAANSPF